MEQGDKVYVQGLIVEALNMVVHGDPERAVWRLVDAAALIGEDLKRANLGNDLGGWGEPTGRGYKVVRGPSLPEGDTPDEG